MHHKYTPIENVEKKIDVVEHINDDHISEILSIARGYTDIKQIESVNLIDIFEEGMLILVNTNNGSEERFIPFLLKGDLEENVLYLAYNAMVKLGESPISSQKKYFEVLDSQMMSRNIIRIIVKSSTSFPEKSPGYAYLLSLKKLEEIPRGAYQNSEKLSKIKQWLYKIFLWRVRKLSSQERLEKMLAFAKNTRYYTLREARKSSSLSTIFDVGHIDIFLHGDTPGGIWARSLKQGDIIHSISEMQDRCDNLDNGQTVIIADETSLPTVIALLENWQNPVSPYVISITQHTADQDYLPDSIVPDLQKLFRLPSDNAAQATIEILQSIPQVDSVWGAIENLDGRAIRKYLRDERNLRGQNNRVKAYWIKN